MTLERKAVISVSPYREIGWKGWVVAVEDPITEEIWQRLFYYKADAVKLQEDLKGRTLENILGTYGTHYFVRVK